MVAALCERNEGSSAIEFPAQREHDMESGLVYMRHRMYDPRIGRFTQVDPVLGNRPHEHYRYAANNPVMMNDPWGKCICGDDDCDGSCSGFLLNPSSWLTRKASRKVKEVTAVTSIVANHYIRKLPPSELRENAFMLKGLLITGPANATTGMLDLASGETMENFVGALSEHGVEGIALAMGQSAEQSVTRFFLDPDYRGEAKGELLFNMLPLLTPIPGDEAGVALSGTLRTLNSADDALRLASSGGRSRWIWGAGRLTEGQAQEAYAAIRASTTDVAAIARYKRLSPERLEAIKKYVFGNPEWIGVDARAAEAWHRLRTGKGTADDMLMLKHEVAEMWLRERKGFGYSEAHRGANKKYNWQEKVPSE